MQIIDDYPTDIAYSTSQFIECFQKIWKILNIKTPYKHLHKNDPYSKPFASLNDPRLSEIEQIYTWLEKWSEQDSKEGKLSKETFHSLIFKKLKIINNPYFPESIKIGH